MAAPPNSILNPSQAGKGVRADLVKEMAESWLPMVNLLCLFLAACTTLIRAPHTRNWLIQVSAFNPSQPTYVVDTGASKVAMIFDVTLVIDAHVLKPCYNTLAIMWTLTLNSEGQITLWEGLHDTGDAQTGHCMGLAMETMKKKTADL